MSSSPYATWLNKLETDYSAYLPIDYYARKSQILSSDGSEAKMAQELYNAVTSRAYSRREEARTGNEKLHLYITRCPDGSMYLTDLNGHGQIMMLKRANGTYEISGPKLLFEIWGGRGVGETFLRRLEDGDFLHDRYPTKRID